MRSRRGRIALVSFALIVFLIAVVAATGMAGQAKPEVLWLPHQVPPAEPAQEWVTYHEGLSGVVVGVAPERASVLTMSGARPLDLDPGESLYLFLLEDAERAEFLAPARVLLRHGHEVFVATRGDAPRLTAASDRSLRGLKQPVRIDLGPRRPFSERAPLLPLPSRTEDPLVREMVDQVSNDSYKDVWQPLDDFETRETYQPNNLAASQWILDTFRSYGLRADFHYYEQSGQRRNVIATLPGLVDSTQAVYICGHFDSGSPTPELCAPGADDNASGTSAVLEAARILSQYAFEYTIKFACFNGEEQGLHGSAAYVRDIAEGGENVIGAYNCDMIAYRGYDPAPADLVIYTNVASRPLAAMLASAIATYLPGQIEPVELVQNMGASDHASFWGFGYRALCSIEAEIWAYDFCPWYHTCDDRIERYPTDYAVSCTKAGCGTGRCSLPHCCAPPCRIIERDRMSSFA